MNGMLYIVGVGPGDPELLTVKAVRTIRSADVIAYPAKEDNSSAAYHIVEQALPEISKKELLPVYFPMISRDLHNEHRTIASEIQEKVQNGKKVVLLTLGDPGFYSTPYHLMDYFLQGGCPVEVICGVASFSAASARLRIPLAVGTEPLLISPGEFCNFMGTQIILKAGTKLRELKEKTRIAGKKAFLIENCGMENEKIYSDIESFPTETGYFSILIVR